MSRYKFSKRFWLQICSRVQSSILEICILMCVCVCVHFEWNIQRTSPTKLITRHEREKKNGLTMKWYTKAMHVIFLSAHARNENKKKRRKKMKESSHTNESRNPGKWIMSSYFSWSSQIKLSSVCHRKHYRPQWKMASTRSFLYAKCNREIKIGT